MLDATRTCADESCIPLELRIGLDRASERPSTLTHRTNWLVGAGGRWGGGWRYPGGAPSATRSDTLPCGTGLRPERCVGFSKRRVLLEGAGDEETH
jgi:hypothetical protein